MKATLEAISPQGFKIRFHMEDPPPGHLKGGESLERLLSRLADVETALKEAGFAPSGELPRTPDGLPICLRHGVPMRKRAKQGDRWYSHAIVIDGHEYWCKGRPGKDSPGWELEDSDG